MIRRRRTFRRSGVWNGPPVPRLRGDALWRLWVGRSRSATAAGAEGWEDFSPSVGVHLGLWRGKLWRLTQIPDLPKVGLRSGEQELFVARQERICCHLLPTGKWVARLVYSDVQKFSHPFTIFFLFFFSSFFKTPVMLRPKTASC